jgi:hypothetical protein
MGAAASIVESSVVETGFEAYGQISDANSLVKADNKERELLGVTTGIIGGGLAELALATTFPAGFIVSAGIGYLSSTMAKSMYDSS